MLRAFHLRMALMFARRGHIRSAIQQLRFAFERPPF
jgi:hypothetical protein